MREVNCMASEKPKIEILEAWSTSTGRYVKVRTDYGLETQLNFNLTVDDEAIERELRVFYRNNDPSKVQPSNLKRGDKITW